MACSEAPARHASLSLCWVPYEVDEEKVAHTFPVGWRHVVLSACWPFSLPSPSMARDQQTTSQIPPGASVHDLAS